MKYFNYATLFLLLVIPLAEATPLTFSYSSVYTEKTGTLHGPLWGSNASKACIANGKRFFVAKQRNDSSKPVLHVDDGVGWQELWVASDFNTHQNPVVVCDINDRVHVLYNTITGKLIHYRFSAPYTSPTRINTDNLSAYEISYLAAAASSTSAQIYLSASDFNTPESARTFNIYYYHDGNAAWYGPYSQTLKFPAQGGYDAPAAKTRNDGSYLYPVITARGHRIFTGAALFPRSGNFTFRKHWVFWDSASYGSRRVDHYYRNVAPGQAGHSEASGTNNFYVAPEAIKQVDDGTIYLLSNIRYSNSTPSLNGSYLNVYSNGLFQQNKLPGTVSLRGMTALGDLIIAVDRTNVIWSCDEGKTWDLQAHNGINHTNNSGQRHNIGYTHVMSDILDSKWVDAFIGIQFKDVGSDPAANKRAEILNIRFNIENLCTS